MKILVLGGTRFLSRAVAAESVRRGHEVVCACRGESGDVPDGAELVVWDRTRPLPETLASSAFNAVVDVARHPSWVRSGVAAFPSAHWVFVSTINVYADEATPGGRPGVTPLREPHHDDVDLAEDPEAYGPMKVSCEQVVSEAASWMIVRPGLIVGPDDPTKRFSYWPRRLARGGEVLAPGSPDDQVQVIDVRDLAVWIVDSAEARTTGTYDAVGPAMPLAELLTACAAGVRAETPATFTWVDQTFLTEQGVQPWSGPGSIPLWLPRPEYDGLLSHDVSPSLAAGLTIRSLADTTRDTLAWLDGPGADGESDGIDADRERELLTAWHAR